MVHVIHLCLCHCSRVVMKFRVGYLFFLCLPTTSKCKCRIGCIYCDLQRVKQNTGGLNEIVTTINTKGSVTESRSVPLLLNFQDSFKTQHLPPRTMASYGSNRTVVTVQRPTAAADNLNLNIMVSEYSKIQMIKLTFAFFCWQ